MNRQTIRTRQIVDWSAAFWSGLVAGSIFYLSSLFVLPHLVGGNAWIILRMFASVLLGESILAPPATFDLGAFLAGAGLHLALSVLLTLLLALIIHRWGLLVGFLGGAMFGLAVYAIHMYTLTLWLPWFYILEGTPFAVLHMIFGALAGLVYEALEVEEFVPVNES